MIIVKLDKKMKKLVILALLIIDFSCLYGQTETDSIFIKKTIGGYLFYHQGEKLTVKQVVEVMEPKASSKDLKAFTAKTCSFIVL